MHMLNMLQHTLDTLMRLYNEYSNSMLSIDTELKIVDIKGNTIFRDFVESKIGHPLFYFYDYVLNSRVIAVTDAANTDVVFHINNIRKITTSLLNIQSITSTKYFTCNTNVIVPKYRHKITLIVNKYEKC